MRCRLERKKRESPETAFMDRRLFRRKRNLLRQDVAGVSHRPGKKAKDYKGCWNQQTVPNSPLDSNNKKSLHFSQVSVPEEITGDVICKSQAQQALCVSSASLPPALHWNCRSPSK